MRKITRATPTFIITGRGTPGRAAATSRNSAAHPTPQAKLTTMPGSAGGGACSAKNSRMGTISSGV